MKLETGVAIVATAVALLASGVLLWRVTGGLRHYTSESWRRAEIARQPRALPDLPLQRASGQVQRLRPWCGQQAMVIDFIYTRCTTVCRGLGATSAQLARRLERQQWPVTVLSLSFDPGHDTPEQLRAYRQSLAAGPSRWELARPMDESALRQMLESFGVVAIADGQGGFEHNAGLHIVDRQCRLVQVLDVDDVEGAMAAVAPLRGAESGDPHAPGAVQVRAP